MPRKAVLSLALGVDDGVDGGDDDQAAGDDEDEEIGHQGGDPELAFQGGERPVENDGDGVLQHPEGERAENQQRAKARPSRPLRGCWRNPVSTSVRVGAKPGAMREISAVSVSSSSVWSKKWEKMTMSTAERGISESIMLIGDGGGEQQAVIAQEKVAQHAAGEPNDFRQSSFHLASAWTARAALANANPGRSRRSG